MEKMIAIAAAGLAALFLGGVFVVTQINSQPDDYAACGASAIAGSAVGGPFELVDGDGNTVTDQDVITQPSLIYFGYTFCPDVCPADNVRNVLAVEVLEEQGISVTPVFISIDPERDTPDVVKDFAANFHERMIGLTGSVDQVAAASRAYKTFYQKEKNGDPDYYLVDHSVQTYFNIPGKGVIDYYGRAETPEQVAQRVSCLIDAAGR